MNLEEKKRIMRGIIDQLEQEYHVKIVPEKEVFEIGIHKVGLDNMSELVTKLLEANFIFRPAIGKLALTQTQTQTQKQNDQQAKTVKVVVTVERDGEEIRRVRYDDWLDTLTIEEIVETIDDAIGSIDEV
jgi:ribonuclease HII